MATRDVIAHKAAKEYIDSLQCDISYIKLIQPHVVNAFIAGASKNEEEIEGYKKTLSEINVMVSQYEQPEDVDIAQIRELTKFALKGVFPASEVKRRNLATDSINDGWIKED